MDTLTYEISHDATDVGSHDARLVVTFYNGPADVAAAAGHCATGVFATSVRMVPDGLAVTFHDADNVTRCAYVPTANVASISHRSIG